MSTKPTTVDFETFGIEGRPKYPPIPVGVSVKVWGKKSKYYGFGHLDGNNCCWSKAREAVRKAYSCKDGVLFQNAKFDLDVAQTWFDLEPPPWDKVHDTMFLLFLDDPHERELGLKESSQRLLGVGKEEQDAVADWLIENQPVKGVKVSRSKASPHYFGRYICLAPGSLVAKYANGDVERTEALFNLLHDRVLDRGMGEAYNRERRLMPILLEMEQQGVPVDLEKLRNDVEVFDSWRVKIDRWIIKTLRCSRTINLNSGPQLFKAMMDAGFVDEGLAPLTPTGKYQTNKEALLLAVTNKKLLGVLKYRAQLNTCLSTFMKPWLKTAEASKGFIYTTWNQVRSPKGAHTGGTRTGRLSSTPNFQNIPNEFHPIFQHDTRDLEFRESLPTSPFRNLPPLPRVRSYIVPFEGEVFIDRDYAQQEPRILGHFDGGKILHKYNSDPWIDFHAIAQNELAKAGKHYDRKPVKNTNLGIIYGMGVGLMAEKNNMTFDEASALKKSILQLYPGIREMYTEMRRRARCHEPIRTWGGREYYCEESKVIDGKLREFDYKMVNVLIQGSAADCTKEALIRTYEAFKKLSGGRWKILLNVHDQLTSSVPPEDAKEAMEVKRRCMESVEFDVPILSEGSMSDTHWDNLKDYDKKGELL